MPLREKALEWSHRSTKAGAETPATRHSFTASQNWTWPAQRRPGPRPRRHRRGLHVHVLVRVRSTKAGAETPATRVHAVAQMFDFLRSTKAGAETPATPLFDRTDVLPDGTLNEGRGRDPGDTLNPGRLPEPTIIAQRRPGPRPRRHIVGYAHIQLWGRSTKAGAETPATLASCRIATPASAPLNEGRGRDPGDTICGSASCAWHFTAQRRPGPRPRRHMLPLHLFLFLPPRSTKAGAETPATRTDRAL